MIRILLIVAGLIATSGATASEQSDVVNKTRSILIKAMRRQQAPLKIVTQNQGAKQGLEQGTFSRFPVKALTPEETLSILALNHLSLKSNSQMDRDLFLERTRDYNLPTLQGMYPYLDSKSLATLKSALKFED